MTKNTFPLTDTVEADMKRKLERLLMKAAEPAEYREALEKIVAMATRELQALDREEAELMADEAE